MIRAASSWAWASMRLVTSWRQALLQVPGCFVERAAVAVRRGAAHGLKDQVLELLVEQVDAAGGDGPEGVAVVGVGQGHELAAVLGAGLLGLLPVLVGHLDGDLGGRRAVVREEDLVQIAGGELGQAPGEDDAGGGGVAQEGRVGEAVELVAHGLVDLRAAVADGVAPDRGDPVEVALPVDVDEVVALGGHDHQRVLVAVDGVGCEGVPDVGVVPGLEGLPGGQLVGHGAGSRVRGRGASSRARRGLSRRWRPRRRSRPARSSASPGWGRRRGWSGSRR